MIGWVATAISSFVLYTRQGDKNVVGLPNSRMPLYNYVHYQALYLRMPFITIAKSVTSAISCKTLFYSRITSSKTLKINLIYPLTLYQAKIIYVQEDQVSVVAAEDRPRGIQSRPLPQLPPEQSIDTEEPKLKLKLVVPITPTLQNNPLIDRLESITSTTSRYRGI